MAVVPAEIKYVASLDARAAELETVEPAICYWTRYWIVQKVMSLEKIRSVNVDRYLTDILDQLEHMKTSFVDLREIQDLSASRKKFETFALAVFENADREEKAKRSDLATARKFLAAATFLEACQVFGTPEKDIVDKRKYCKAQAMRIRSAIAAGRDPNQSRRQVTGTEVQSYNTSVENLKPDLHTLESSESLSADRQVSLQNEASITDHSYDHDVEETLQAPVLDVPAIEDEPSKIYISDDISHDPVSVDLSCSGPHDTTSPEIINSDLVQRTPEDVTTSPNQHRSPESATTRAYCAVEQIEVSKIDSLDQVKNGNDSGRYRPSMSDIETSQKHAKWAISALNYEDIDTAVLELRKALSVLGS